MRIPRRLVLLLVVLGAWGLAELAHLRGFEHAPGYRYGTALLLAIGLFASTAGIDRAEAAVHKRLILLAVTVGVLLKAAIIGGLLYLATSNPVFLVLGIAVAQIDPLSVAAIMGDDRMSARVKAILASWASFDDPVTVILVIYAPVVLGSTSDSGRALGGYGLDVLLNLAFAAVAYGVWRLLRDRPRLLYPVLAVLLAVAVWQFLMLGVAIAGLFVRPAWLIRHVGRATTWALLAAGALLGLLLVNGISLGYGVALGVMAFVAQIVAALLLSRGLNRDERITLALAQQNGITAIILALRLEVDIPTAVAVIAPAILVTNVIHAVANARRPTPTTPPPA